MNAKHFRLLNSLLLVSLLEPALAIAQSSDRPDGMRFVPDVLGQFLAQTERADALGFHIGGSPDPSACRHYQAITRVDGADGTPFFLVTRSGNTPDLPNLPDELSCNDSDGEIRNGNLIVFRMDSRDKNGERLRSNRLRKGAHIVQTPPPLEDKASIYFTVVGGDPADPDPAKRPGLVVGDGEGSLTPRVYQHPGGMQLVGHMLGMALETPRPFPNGCSPCFSGVPNPFLECDVCFNYDRAPNRTAILFFDVSNPEAPVFTSQFVPTNAQDETLAGAGVLGVTPLPGGRYLMVVTGGQNTTLFFYRSTIDDLSSSALEWERVGSTPGPVVTDAHQTLNFLRERDINGSLYLIGARGSGNPLDFDHDRTDLYLVECRLNRQFSPNCEPGDDVELTVVRNGRRVAPSHSSGGGGRQVNLAAASGFYVSPSGELIMYATEHDNDGPSGTVKAGEWRNIDMARANSPLMLPTVVVNGPYEVDEGRSVSLSGSAGPPITKAWIELFHELDFGGYEFSSLYPVVDFDDYDLDDYDDFFTFELGNHLDRVRSWKWFAPEGCSIRAIDHRANNSIETRILVGDGFLYNEDIDLAQVLNDHGDDDMGPGADGKGVDGVDFLSGCDSYYAAPVILQWDLDVNGTFETTGSPVTFNAIFFDGPDVVEVPAQAQNSRGGQPGQTTARVTVRNVAPEFSQFRVTNGAGQQVNVDVPFVLTKLPVTVNAGFSDPGVLDHQTATLSWGDGAVDPNTTFTMFNEAFGDGTGALTHAHRYTLAGSYPIALTVTDDDGGMDAESTVVRVVTPEQAVAEIIGLLDGVIASTTNSRILKDLQKARKALAGNANGNNGALNKIRNGNDQAAIAFLRQAIDALRQAQAGGANVSMLISLLEQVVAALSAA